MPLIKPALDPLSVDPTSRTSYPEPYRSRVMPREKRELSEQLGLKKIGVNGGEQTLTAGSCAGFAAGARDGHQLINCSYKPAVYLEVSNRDAGDHVYYPDPDVDMVGTPEGMKRRDGSPVG